ncbi:MAG: tetratricopeptide (TPR) repeat protein [Crocinitomix sp.]
MKYLYITFCLLVLAACGGDSDQPKDLTDVLDQKDDTTVIAFDSLKFFNDQVIANPGNSDWLFKRAVYVLAKGDVAKSKSDLELAIQVDSTNMDARLLYGNLQLSMTHLDTSKFHYEYILQRDSTNTGALIGMSKLYALLNNSAMADIFLSSAIAVDPYLAEAYFMRGIVYRSDYYETARQESWDIAVSSFQTCIEQDPEYYSAFIEMGVMYDQAGSELSLEYYNSALDIYPESQEAWYNIGMYHQTRGNVDEALVAYTTINNLDSTWADPYYNQGYVHLLMTKELDSAIFYFTKATDCDPNYFQAYNNLGLAYETKGDFDNAKKSYQRAVEANPNFQLAKDNLERLQ